MKSTTSASECLCQIYKHNTLGVQCLVRCHRVDLQIRSLISHPFIGTHFLKDAQNVTKFFGSVSCAMPMITLPEAPTTPAITPGMVADEAPAVPASLWATEDEARGGNTTSENLVNDFFSC